MNGHLATVGRDVGRILRVLSGMMFVCVLVAAVWGEFYAIPAFLFGRIASLQSNRSPANSVHET